MERDFLDKVEKRTLELTDDDFRAIHDYYRAENRGFRRLMKKTLQRVRSRQDLPILNHLYQNLTEEINDISPFLAHDFNKIFRSMMDWGFYKGLADMDSLVAACGNPQLLELLKEFITVRADVFKFLNNLEIYKIKKLIHDLSVKFNNRDDIVVKLEMELSQEDMDWIDHLE
ncbi:MAG: hypothetical protein A2014_00150 [Spirochaetes bacterium GWF1_49_6]|nr:MAG: hypothetical protein A2014_00150 [Spirochaetes bacterium GWF1_49_6]